MAMDKTTTSQHHLMRLHIITVNIMVNIMAVLLAINKLGILSTVMTGTMEDTADHSRVLSFSHLRMHTMLLAEEIQFTKHLWARLLQKMTTSFVNIA